MNDTELQASLLELRDKLNTLIESFEKTSIKDFTVATNDSVHNKATRRLTPAELAEFLSDSSTVNNKEIALNASVKELTTLSPNGGSLPYENKLLGALGIMVVGKLYRVSMYLIKINRRIHTFLSDPRAM
ncbi:unnamed protein product [Mucor hiemalis]